MNKTVYSDFDEKNVQKNVERKQDYKVILKEERHNSISDTGFRTEWSLRFKTRSNWIC